MARWFRRSVDLSDELDDDVCSDSLGGEDAPFQRGAVGTVLGCIFSIAGFFLWCGYCIGQFASRWYWTRPRRAFWLGVPAVVSVTALLVFVLFAVRTTKSELINQYNRKAMHAYSRNDFEAAELYFRRMSYLDDTNQGTRFGLAIIAERQGDVARARTQMQRIAPDDDSGNPRAHFWLARDLATNHGPLDNKSATLVEHHLQHAVKGMPDHLDAHRMLGELYVFRKKFDKAVLHFDQVAKTDPSVLLVQARLYVLMDRKPQAERMAQQAIERFQALTENEPDDPSHCFQWAEAELFLLHHKQAADILFSGLRQSKPEHVAQFRQALSTTLLSWCDAETRSDPDQLTRRFELLQQALQFGPDNPLVLGRLAEFAVKHSSEEATAELKRILSTGRAPGIVHFVVGTAALGTPREAEGLHHLELAFEQLPQMPAVANNLAWALANASEPNLERAAQIIQAAVELAPEHPQIRETRGQILAKLGKTKEAIVDLEYALSALTGREKIHETLASLYEDFGDKELAEQHRQLAAAAAAAND